MSKYLIFLSALFLLTCESSERIWSNPNDPAIDSSAWAPFNLQAQVLNDSEIKLTWEQEETRIAGFRIERSTGGPFTQIAEVEADVTEYTDTGLSIDTDYIYRIKAFTDLNESEYTDKVEMTLFYDCLGVFMGNAVEDCAGDCYGTAYENECGCVGGSTGLEEDFCYDCTDPEAFNYDPDATIDDGSCYFTVTDIDGNVYKTIIIGAQEWMVENLKVTHYRDGTAIPMGHNNSVWSNLSTGAYAVYNDDESNADTYGYLYNWYAVNDSRKIAPEGWHVPTDAEWKELEMHLGMSQLEADQTGWRGTNEGSKLAGRAELWSDGNLKNNSEFGTSGFTVLPNGYRDDNYGSYGSMGYSGYFWSATESLSSTAWYRLLSYGYSDVYRSSYNKRGGFSVRCVRD